LSIPDDVSLNIFYSCLDIKFALDLNVAAGGLFAQTTPTEGREILYCLLENSSVPTDHNKPHQEESESSHESLSTAKSKLSFLTPQDSSVEPSPEPRTPKEEEIHHLKFSSQFEDDPSGNIRNTSNHLRHEKPDSSPFSTMFTNSSNFPPMITSM
jgi:hypothetical protein